MARRDKSYPKYYDGLDEDGYPAPREPWRKPYIHGSEADVGENFKPIQIGDAFVSGMVRENAKDQIGNSAESPIELQLGAAIILMFRRADKPLRLCLVLDKDKTPDELLLIPQFNWSFYRSDWAILNPTKNSALLIECDGKPFHSTKDQIHHDLKKDAAARDRGFLTMRFTGSEIHKDADNCALKIYDAICGDGE